MTVAILDSGLDFEHSDFQEKIKAGKIKAKDFTGQKKPKTDPVGHGTHCAGLIGAGNITTDLADGFRGLAPEADLLIGKVINGNRVGYIDWLIKGLEWAESMGSDLISLSVYTSRNSPRLYKVIHRILAKGICIICAAGNEGALAQNGIGYPGRYGGVITVAAHDEHGRPSGFSSSGGELDFMAPGTKIWSTFTPPKEPTFSLKNIKLKKIRYAEMSGTSMATPFVAGLAALIISVHKEKRQRKKNETPILNNEDLKEHLLRLAAHPGFHDHQTGYGPLLPFQLVSGDTSIRNFPDVQPTYVHARPGEPVHEMDDRAYDFQLRDEAYWENLIRSSSGRAWADHAPYEVQKTILQQADAVAVIIDQGTLQEGKRCWEMSPKSLLDRLQGHSPLNPQNLPIPSNISDPHYPSVSCATGFMVGADLMMTCRHALEQDGEFTHKQKYVVFGYRHNKEGEEVPSTFQKKQVYRIAEVIAYGEIYEDWALVRLDRKVEILPNSSQLTLEPEEKSPQTPVYAIGHPLGLPLQLSCDGQIFVKENGQAYQTDLDLFAGSSGSPVFDANTFQVIGIYIQGQKQAVEEENGEISIRIDIGPGEGEIVQLITPAYQALQQHLQT
ncbi:MAG: S8 family serine peptidase [Bacteroidota bacterium]